MKGRPMVLVTNKGGHDYSDAERFGRLVYMSSGRLSRFGVSNIVRQFKHYIERSGPDDYILLTSLSVSCAVAAALFAVKHKRLNLLIFKEDKYVERKVLL